jgi:cobalt-zinc-cadmium efflux system outer membrane protein
MKRKTFSKYLLCIGLATAATLPGQAAGSDGLSLDRAIRLALENNPELQASDARKEAAAVRQEQARAWPNPELELSSEDMPVNRSRMSQGKHMAGISQTLPWPGKRKADGEIGTADAAAGAADWRLDRADLVREVKVAYYQVQAAERSAAVAEDLVKVAKPSRRTPENATPRVRSLCGSNSVPRSNWNTPGPKRSKPSAKGTPPGSRSCCC